MARNDKYHAGALALRQVHSWGTDCDDYGDNPDGCPWAISLPHQCDAWMVGGLDEALLMLADLQEAIKKLRDGTR